MANINYTEITLDVTTRLRDTVQETFVVRYNGKDAHVYHKDESGVVMFIFTTRLVVNIDSIREIIALWFRAYQQGACFEYNKYGYQGLSLSDIKIHKLSFNRYEEK